MIDFVSDSEEVARNLYTPYHYDIEKQKVKPAAFKPPAGSNEISTLRLQIWTLKDILNYGKLCETTDKIFMGAGVLRVEEIRQKDVLEVVASPMQDEKQNIYLKAHADIIYLDYTSEKGKEAPPAILMIMKKLANLASTNNMLDSF